MPGIPVCYILFTQVYWKEEGHEHQLYLNGEDYYMYGVVINDNEKDADEKVQHYLLQGCNSSWLPLLSLDK